jgi:hypothetical protein
LLNIRATALPKRSFFTLVSKLISRKDIIELKF